MKGHDKSAKSDLRSVLKHGHHRTCCFPCRSEPPWTRRESGSPETGKLIASRGGGGLVNFSSLGGQRGGRTEDLSSRPLAGLAETFPED